MFAVSTYTWVFSFCSYFKSPFTRSNVYLYITMKEPHKIKMKKKEQSNLIDLVGHSNTSWMYPFNYLPSAYIYTKEGIFFLSKNKNKLTLFDHTYI
ncbi:hypothetical protein Hanom_Chr17g01563781 [Helianthus anomalus]